MTNIPTLRAVLSRVESLKGPLTRGEAEKVADKLFILSHDRESWRDVVAALGGGRAAQGAVCALIKREGIPHWNVDSVSRAWVGGHHAYDKPWQCNATGSTPALALLAAYLRALIAEAEQAGQRAGKAS